MSDFMIQCAICGTNFNEEKEYEDHKCNHPSGQTQVKLEPVEEEEELDVKPVLSSTGAVVPPQDNIGKDNSNKKKKKKKKRKVVAPYMTRATEKTTNEETSKNTQQTLPVDVSKIKPEPIDLCEVINVKDEPESVAAAEVGVGQASDPLATNSLEDILNLQQEEDYLIENFVEYDNCDEIDDDEESHNLEIDESSSEPQEVSGEKTPMDKYLQVEKHKVSPNVGKRIMQTTNTGHGCTICNKKFFEKHMLDEHLKLAHRTPRPYSCIVCNKKFTHKNYVNLHMRVHTGEKPYKCNLCSRSYSHKTSFTIHMRIHKGDRPYECTVCGKKCYDKSGLTSHMRSHTKETPYQCECCGRRFTHSKSLLVHRRNHTGEKPYVCPHCGRAFRHWHKHKIHIRLHTGERPYKCKICNKGFPRNDEVKRHMRSHTGIKSFKCSICGVYCATQASITGHINLHHVNLTKDKKYLPEKTIVENSESGVLGKKIQYQKSIYRQVDVDSYDQYLDPKPKDKPRTLTDVMSSTPSTLVTTRPMTPQEKVANKSMTYRQFLNDQEQQLLAKGLKVVVNKSNNTYGLAPISPPTTETTPEETTEELKDCGIPNAFVKVPYKRSQQIASITNKPTRIILPNLNSNKPVILGETPSKLLLQSSDQEKSDQSNADSSLAESTNKSVAVTQPILIQTVGNSSSGLSAPMILQHAPQPGQAVQISTSATKTTSSILEAALTNRKSDSKSTDAQSTPDAGGIIVLNKGISGGTSTAPPLVVLQPQPVMQQQLLLLPGVNGGPARLVILQQPTTTTTQQPPPIISLDGAPAVPPVVKQEPAVSQDSGETSKDNTIASAVSSSQQILVLTPKNKQADQDNSTTPAVKQEPMDSTDTVPVKVKQEQDEDDISSPIILPNMIKMEPLD